MPTLGGDELGRGSVPPATPLPASPPVMTAPTTTARAIIGPARRSTGDAGVTRTYSTTQLGSHLAQGFRDLWEERRLFDCTIVVNAQSFRLHKGLLIAMSPYFRSMFTSGFEEAGKSQVELKGVTPAGFSAVVHFLYTSEISLHEGSLQDVIEAAAHLQIPCLLDFCAHFMQQVLTTANCLEYLRLLDMYGHLAGQEGIIDFIAQNCRLLRERDDFWTLPYEFFVKILRSDDLGVTSEVDVLRIALTWLQQNGDCKQCEIENLLASVRLPLIPEAELHGSLDQLVESLPQRKRVQEYLQVASSGRHVAAGGDAQHLNSPRSAFRRSYCTESGLFVIRHPRDASVNNACYVLHKHSSGQFAEKTPMDDLPQAIENATVVQLDNYIFLTGGNVVGRRVSSECVYRFDMFTRRWVKMEPMHEGRALHGAAGLRASLLVVVGGLIVHDASSPRGDYTSSVEVYHLRENRWLRARPFPYKVCNIQACTVRGHMYTCGGTVDVAPRPRVNSYRLHAYDDVADEWVERSSMHAKKQWHVMYALRDRIYVFGGVSSGDAEFLPGYNINFQYANMAEVYDPQANQWTVLAFPQTMQAQQALQRPLGGAFHIGNTLYFVARRKLLVYNPETNVWRLMDYERGDLGVGDLLAVVNVPADCL